MAISPRLRNFLTENEIPYEIIWHAQTSTSQNSASAAHIPDKNMAKPVILEDNDGYLMAVIPANQHVKIRELNRTLNRNMGLATEWELQQLFEDCLIGAIPPIGQAYGIRMVIDDSLLQCTDVYFEAGDHEELVHIKGSSFRKLMQDTPHTNLCMH